MSRGTSKVTGTRAATRRRLCALAASAVLLSSCYESDSWLADPPDDAPPAAPGGSCGDGVCDPTLAESCTRCESDCGACPATCSARVTPPEPGIDYAAQVQPILSSRCTSCHGSSDPEAGLDLTSLAGARSVVTPCDCAGSLLYQKTGPTPPYGDRMPADGPPYLSDAERALICQWIDEGAAETYTPGACDGAGDTPSCPACGDGACDTTESCADCSADCGACSGGGGGDQTAPAFQGVDYVSDGSSAGGCDVYWDPAHDDVTPADRILYRIYLAPENGSVDFTAPFAEAVGVGHLIVSPPEGQRYTVVVRAVDEAGNADDNLELDDCNLE